MRAAIYRGAGRVTLEEVPEPVLAEASDALVRVIRSCVCGSDLWAYRGVIERQDGARLGHEFIGIVEAVGAAVRQVRVGELVVAPFQWSDNTCPYCQDGLQTACLRGGTFGAPGTDGGQGERVRVPEADGTLVSAPGVDEAADERLLLALLALTDVMATGLHGAVLAGVGPGDTVAVVGDGAVGLCAVLGAKRVLGAERVLLMSRHPDRQALGRAFGADEVLPERGEEAVALVRERTQGLGVRHTVEAVGTPQSWEMAQGMTRDGGSIGAVGVPHQTRSLPLFDAFLHQFRIGLGIAPVRHYLPRLLALVQDGELDPSPIFDLTLPLAQVADGYRAMSERRAIKVALR
ncbi:MAG: zinc-binding dehydrogenase [Candidatus Dormibacteria bacterium]